MRRLVPLWEPGVVPLVPDGHLGSHFTLCYDDAAVPAAPDRLDDQCGHALGRAAVRPGADCLGVAIASAVAWDGAGAVNCCNGWLNRIACLCRL